MNNKYIIIKDGRTLKALARKFNFEYDRKFKYITNDDNIYYNQDFKNQGYFIKYFSGCFYPFICKRMEE